MSIFAVLTANEGICKYNVWQIQTRQYLRMCFTAPVATPEDFFALRDRVDTVWGGEISGDRRKIGGAKVNALTIDYCRVISSTLGKMIAQLKYTIYYQAMMN